MMQVSAKLCLSTRGFAHWCPACKQTHSLFYGWKFTNRGKPDALIKPSFEPSFRHTGKQEIVDAKGEWTGDWVRGPDGKALDACCHYILTDGILNFCPDCTHALAGKSVPLPDLPHWLCDDPAAPHT